MWPEWTLAELVGDGKPLAGYAGIQGNPGSEELNQACVNTRVDSLG